MCAETTMPEMIKEVLQYSWKSGSHVKFSFYDSWIAAIIDNKQLAVSSCRNYLLPYHATTQLENKPYILIKTKNAQSIASLLKEAEQKFIANYSYIFMTGYSTFTTHELEKETNSCPAGTYALFKLNSQWLASPLRYSLLLYLLKIGEKVNTFNKLFTTKDHSYQSDYYTYYDYFKLNLLINGTHTLISLDIYKWNEINWKYEDKTGFKQVSFDLSKNCFIKNEAYVAENVKKNIVVPVKQVEIAPPDTITIVIDDNNFNTLAAMERIRRTYYRNHR